RSSIPIPKVLRDEVPSESRWPGHKPGHDPRLLLAVVAVFLAQALERYDLLVLSGVEHDHTLRRASGDADACDWRANELAPIRDQHHLIGFFHPDRPTHLPALFPPPPPHYSFAPAP